MSENEPLSQRLYPVWLLRLMLPFGWPLRGVLTLLLIMAVTWGILYAVAEETEVYERAFFAAVIAYSIVIFSRIVQQSLNAFDELRPELDLSATDLDTLRLKITHKPAAWFAFTLAGALLFALLHLTLIYSSQGASLHNVVFSGKAYGTHLGTIGTWIVLTANISALVDNAIMWAQLGNNIRIDLFRPGAARAIGRIAVMSTLSVIGAQVLFVILIMGRGWDWYVVFPGLLASLIPAFALFIIPVWQLRVRLSAVKEEILLLLDGDIRVLAPLHAETFRSPDNIDQYNRLLTLRRETLQASVWPFDGSNLLKLGFYLLLPPLTWVGAALVENLVDFFLD